VSWLVTVLETISCFTLSLPSCRASVVTHVICWLMKPGISHNAGPCSCRQACRGKAGVQVIRTPSFILLNYLYRCGASAACKEHGHAVVPLHLMRRSPSPPEACAPALGSRCVYPPP